MRTLILIPLLAAAPALAVNLPAPKQDRTATAPALPDDFLEDVTPAEAAKEDMRQGDARRWEESREAESQASAAGSARAPEPGVDCPKPSGTTGAILGAVAGGILGNVIDGGRHRAIGTLAGAGGGALLGKSIEQKSAKCR